MILGLLAGGSSFAGQESEEPSAKAEAGRSIAIEADESLVFSIVEIKAQPGEFLSIIFTNTAPADSSEVLHNVAFLNREFESQELLQTLPPTEDNFGLPENLREICLGETSIAKPGEEVELSFQAPWDKGNFTFFCTIPGHAFLGMQGLLVVE